jgi:hypothetical protein
MELYTLENGETALEMEQEFKNGKMGQSILASGCKAKLMARER